MRNLLSATATRTTAGTTAIIAAVASKRHHIVSIVISAYAYNATATAAIADSATTFIKQEITTANGNFWSHYFGESGLPLAAGSALNLVTATANSSVVVTVTYWTSH